MMEKYKYDLGFVVVKMGDCCCCKKLVPSAFIVFEGETV